MVVTFALTSNEPETILLSMITTFKRMFETYCVREIETDDARNQQLNSPS